MPSLSQYLRSLMARSPGGIRMNPERDWAILLTLASIALAAVVAWNIWIFDTVVSGRALGEVATQPASTVNQASLEAIRDLFAKRAAEEAKYRDGTYRFADPSQQP